MQDLFTYADEIGPAKIIHIYEPAAGLKGILVVDNVAMGPAIGGVRIALDVSVNECFRLARAMTFKNAAAGYLMAEANGYLCDPKMPKYQKQQIMRAAAVSLRNEESYIFGPDMGTDEECMAWVRDENGRSVGLPTELAAFFR